MRRAEAVFSRLRRWPTRHGRCLASSCGSVGPLARVTGPAPRASTARRDCSAASRGRRLPWVWCIRLATSNFNSSRNPLECAVCARTVDPNEGRVVLGLGSRDGDFRPDVESVAAVCGGACRDGYSRPGSELFSYRLDELNPELMVHALMPKFRWTPWSFDPFIAILAAVEIHRRQSAVAPKRLADE